LAAWALPARLAQGENHDGGGAAFVRQLITPQLHSMSRNASFPHQIELDFRRRIRFWLKFRLMKKVIIRIRNSNSKGPNHTFSSCDTGKKVRLKASPRPRPCIPTRTPISPRTRRVHPRASEGGVDLERCTWMRPCPPPSSVPASESTLMRPVPASDPPSRGLLLTLIVFAEPAQLRCSLLEVAVLAMGRMDDGTLSLWLRGGIGACGLMSWRNTGSRWDLANRNSRLKRATRNIPCSTHVSCRSTSTSFTRVFFSPPTFDPPSRTM